MNINLTKLSLIAAASVASAGMFAQPSIAVASSNTKAIECSVKFLGQYNANTDRMNGIYKQDCEKNGREICDLKILGQKSPSTFNGIIKGKGCDYTLKVLAQHEWDCDNKVLGQSTLTTFNGIYKNDCKLTYTESQPTPTPTQTPDNDPTPTPTPTPDNDPTPTPANDEPTPTPTKVMGEQDDQGNKPTPTPEVLGKVTELPSTGPGIAVLAAIGSIGAALIGKKHFTVN